MSYLDALRAELVGYERTGKTDRADQVRAEIARVSGAASKREAESAESAPALSKTAPSPRGRRSPRNSTA